MAPTAAPPRRRRWKRIVLLLVLALLLAAFLLARELASLATAYSARVACSGIFIAQRTEDQLLAEELARFPLMQLNIDRQQHRVTTSIGPFSHSAVFREGLGSVLELGDSLASLTAPGPLDPALAERPWPLGELAAEADSSAFDQAAVASALALAFAQPPVDAPKFHTRALLAVHRGRIIAEQYAPGIGRDTPLLGWSMTKSMVNALLGIAVQDGLLDIHQPVGLSAWSDLADPRHTLTPDQLLRMSSGLQFSERYGDPFSDVVKMLFASPSAAAYAIDQPLAYQPDSRWAYSSGSTNILCRVLHDALGGDQAASLAFPRERLFAPLGMRTALIEPDSEGTLIGSSFGWASARDWARLGMLLLDDGVWQGERLLPEGWVAYSTTPTPHSSGRYGAHLWLNVGPEGAPEKRWLPSMPDDLFAMRGYEGQLTLVLPSRQLVVVRLGCDRERNAFPLEPVLQALLEALN